MRLSALAVKTLQMTNEELNRLSQIILDSSIMVHKEMGPGLLESIYSLCLINELKDRNISMQTEVSIPLLYKGTNLSKDFKIDILVENNIIIELKAVDILLSVHEAQIISYLKLANKKLGFLINFNVSLLKQGFRRFVNNF